MKNTKNLKNTTNESVDLKTFRNDLGQWEIFDDQDRLAPFPHSSKAEAQMIRILMSPSWDDKRTKLEIIWDQETQGEKAQLL